jgi:hypothetical protein
MIELKPLKNPIENRPTVLRVYRSLFNILNETPTTWFELNEKIRVIYFKLAPETPVKVNQKRIFGKSKSKKKVFVYPPEFIPVMVNIIKEHVKNK